ncbi:MAG: NACHT domain-containing protein [Leptolyngbya sp. SIOISBB]|nr:NACHT domain-containing protein [Leptolyngbya sp. SIOISBB]
MLELLAIATGIELGKFVLDQVLDLSKPVLENYVQDFFKDCLDSGLARLKANTLKQPMAEAIGFFIQRFIKELQFYDIPDTSINHHYKSALKQFVRDKAVGSILGKAFETGCKKIDYAQLEAIWTEQYQQPGWQFPTEDFDWRSVTKEYLIQVKSIVKADAELRALLETDLLEELVHNTAQLSPGFDLGKYRESLQTSYGYLKLYALDSSYRADSIRLWRMFIEQTVREGLPPTRYDLPLDIKHKLQKAEYLEADLPDGALEIYSSEYFKQPDRKVLEVLADTQHSVILGDPGSGKSTLLQFLALNWVEGKTEVLPLMIELREYALAQSSNFLDFLYRGKGADWQFDQQQLHRHLLENPTLVMFDGLDEVFDRPTQSAITDDIIRFAQSYPQASVLVTSRIIGYQGYNSERFKHSGFSQFTIQELNDAETHEFIDRWYDLSMGNDPDKVRLKQRLKDAINNSKAVQNLADSPLLLTMMAILNRRQELPRDRADLYDQASRVLLYHWDIDHKGRVDSL